MGQSPTRVDDREAASAVLPFQPVLPILPLETDMRTFIAALFVTTSTLAIAQTAPPATPLWSVTEGLDSPESVYYDAASGFLFSSQIGGDASARDGNGR